MDEPAQPRRPIGVWLISIYTLGSAAVGAAVFAILLAGRHADAITAAYLKTLTPADYTISLVAVLVSLLAGFSLLLLRRAAVLFYAVSLLLSVSAGLLNLARGSAGARGGIAGLVFGWLILAGIITYCRRLARAGVLG